MNRNQRRYGRSAPKKDDCEEKLKATGVANYDIEEILPPRFKGNVFDKDKSVADRCCYIRPHQKDVEQSVDSYILDEHLNDLIRQQYDFHPIIPDTIKHLKELREVLCGSSPKVENYSQYAVPKPNTTASLVDTCDWQKVDNTDDVEQLLSAENKGNKFPPKTLNSKNVYISDTPRVKLIAEKFSKFTRNNVELRRLDEKIVCVEYDVYEQKDVVDKDFAAPIQAMRAYFSVRPTDGTDADKTVQVLPSIIKHEFHVTDEDLQKQNEKEVEIIDGEITENISYLDDLKRVLKRKKAIYAKKKKSSLDLKSLYEMAKRESPSLDEDHSDTNLLSKAELEEIKDLINKNCSSSVRGINRHTLKCDKEMEPKRDGDMNVISESILAELLRNGATT